MPTKTFEHLKPQKKQRIVEAALAEFSRHDYEHVNIQNIIKDAQISRGSFYQYFQDLDDLFDYLVIVIRTEKMQYFENHGILSDHAPLFDRIGEIYRLGYQFALDHPLIFQAGRHMVATMSHQQNHVTEESDKALKAYFESAMKEDIERGNIREDVDIEILNQILSDFLNELLKSHYVEQRLTQDEVDQRFKRFITLLKKGIA